MLWLAAILAALLGFVAVGLGLRGRRIDAAPVCRRCRFNLSGVYPSAQTCPECGTDLSKPKAVRTGQRRRMRGVLACGVVLLLVGLGGGGALGWGKARGFDWNTVKPVWLLVQEGASNNNATADAALKELVRRVGAQSLSQERRDAILARALDLQANPATAWRAGWGDFVETLWLGGLLSQEDQRRYARQSVLVKIAPRLKVRRGDGVPLLLHVISRAGSLGVLEAHVLVQGYLVGGQHATPGLSNIRTPVSGFHTAPFAAEDGPNGWRWRGASVPGAPPGRHAVRARVEVFVGRTPPGPFRGWSSAGGGPEFDESVWAEGWLEQTPKAHVFDSRFGNSGSEVLSDPLVTWRTEAAAEVEILDASEPDIELVSDESLRAQIERCVEKTAAHVHGGGGWQLEAGGFLYAGSETPPMDLAFEVFWRSGGREVPVGTMIVRGGPMRVIGGNPWYGGPLEAYPGPAVDVVLRASADAARRTPDVTRIWDGEIVVPNVEVRDQRRPGR